jgi:hypothetical protein
VKYVRRYLPIIIFRAINKRTVPNTFSSTRFEKPVANLAPARPPTKNPIQMYAAALVTIQDLLGHGQITTTQQYCRVADFKVQRGYYRAIEVVMLRTQLHEKDRFELPEKQVKENRA